VNDPIGQLGIEEIPMIGPPASKHSGGHQAPRTEAEKRRAAKRRRAQLLAPVQVVHAAPAPPPVCGHRWRNKRPAPALLPAGARHRRRGALRPQSRANAWDPRREAEVAKRAGRVAAAVKQDIENGLVARDAAPEGGGS
jgi:hypothetical protein